MTFGEWLGIWAVLLTLCGIVAALVIFLPMWPAIFIALIGTGLLAWATAGVEVDTSPRN